MNRTGGALAVLSAAFLCMTVPAAAQPPASVGLPLRSIHASGNWGTNELVVAEWEADRTRPLVPPEYIEWLGGLHVNWLGLSVALTYDDSMDSTVERNTEYLPPSDDVSFSDDALRQLIREFREHGIDVYLTLAFQASGAQMSARPVERWQLGDPGGEDGVPCCDTGILPENWPWRPGHPDHRRFVAEFWETYTQHAVHVARLAEEEGVRLFSLGTETDSLFRTRPGGHFTNDFGSELLAMVSRVRAVYSGLLTYDQHYGVLVDRGPGSAGSDHLWNDLDLDLVGVSAWFPLVDSPPSTVMSVESLRESYERVFRDYLIPLATRNPNRPIVFLEYGAPSAVEAPVDPAGDWTVEPFVFTDMNGNGIDDGNETQANIYRALLDTMSDHPGLIDGVFWWGNWMTTADMWAGYWATRRTSAIRDKPAGEVVRSVYAAWRDRASRPPERIGALPPVMMGIDDATASIDVAGAFRNPDGDRLMYRATSSAPAVAATSVSGSTVTVTPVAAGTATVTVTAIDPSGLSVAQSFGVTVTATATGSFTDDPLVPGVTPVKAVHFTELRTRIDALRVTAGLQPFGWTDPVLGPRVTPIRLVHLLELRSALSAVYEAMGRSAPSFTDTSLEAGRAVIRSIHLMELRAAVVALG